MTTKQKPHSFKRYPLNHMVVETATRRIACKDMDINGMMYSVPSCISRYSTYWAVRLLGRAFLFHDGRYDPDPEESLDRAVQFLVEYDHVQSVGELPFLPRKESNTKNIEFGVAGIDGQWKLNTAKEYRFHIRVRKLTNYGNVAFSVAIKPEDINPANVAKQYAKALYIAFMCESYPMLETSQLRHIWKQLKAGTLDVGVIPELPELLMQQIADNLEYTEARNEGDGWVHPYTNQLVF